MLWEYVYIGSDIVRSSIIGLCLTWPTRSSTTMTPNRKVVCSRKDRTKKRRATTHSLSGQSRHNQAPSALGTLLALESRIMFDGAAFVTGTEVLQDQGAQESITQNQDILETPAETKAETFSNPFTGSIDLLTGLSRVAPPTERQEIIFIDTSIDDYQTLLLGIDPTAEAVLLDPERDGVEQISEILKDRSDIDAIHIISHGNQGELRLGKGTLDLTSMQGEYADEMSIIHQALNEKADLLIYGCNFGKGEEGQHAASLLAELTGADIAASTDLTGNANLGGDWDLEIHTGEIESTLMINEQATLNWSGLLATFNVSNTNDSGAGSLRQAIIDANNTVGTDTINLPSGTYTLLGPNGEDAAASGDLDITDDVIIAGAGAATTIVDGNGIDRVFHTHGTSDVTIGGITIQDGASAGGAGVRVDDSSILNLNNAIVSNNAGADEGGGFHVHGTLNLDGVLLSNNSANRGGGIYFHGADGGSLTNVTISGHTVSGGNGGGIWNDSTITVTSSTINGNSAVSGGGIYNEGTIDISSSTVNGNMADTGAGIYNDTSSTSLTFTNATVSGNTATSAGGGLYTEKSVTMVNSTFTLNSADSGGGIRTQTGAGTVDLLNTIVAGNTAISANPDLQGNFTTSGFNLIGDGTGQSDLVNGVSNDQVGSGGSPINAMLVALADNGGLTQTHALLAGSPARNAGTAAGAPAVDQRGVTRDATPDIGAFELSGLSAPTLDLDANDSSGATGNDYAFPFTEGDSPTAIADSDTDLVDVDSTTFASVKLAVSGLLDGNAETLVLDGDTFALATTIAGQDTTGGNYHVVIGTTAGTATLTITKQGGGTFSEVETETLIQTIQYQHTDTSTPTDGDRLIDVIVNDGTLDSVAARSTINVNPVNDPPSFSGLDNTPTFTQGGGAVVLDNNATIADPELDGSNNYNGATLTLTRNGGANAEDLFDGSGTLNALVESGNLVVGSTTIGTVTTNSGGTLLLTFNGSATTSLVSSTLQQITYANSSGTPPANVQIAFTIDDGNMGGQGTGGRLNDTGSILVTINAANVPPVAMADGFTVLEGSANTLNLAGNDSDADDGLDLASIVIVSGPTNGTITSINNNGTVDYAHDGSETIADSFTYTINDLSGATSNTVTVSLTVTPQNDPPIITSNGGGASAAITIIEGTTAVTDVNASDAEGALPTYSIVGGADAAFFSIDSSTGVLTFNVAPNSQAPGDAGGNNVYDVVVQASDGLATDTQAIAVTVAPVPPVVVTPPPPTPTPSPPPNNNPPGQPTQPPIVGNPGFLPPSTGNPSSNSSNSTAKDPKDADSRKDLSENELLALQQLNESQHMSRTTRDLLAWLQNSFDATTINSKIQSLLAPGGFLKDLDRVRDTFEGVAETEKTYLASSIAVSTGLSVGYVFWLLRSGVLLAALLSSVPAWQFVNPLLVLDTSAKRTRGKSQENLEDDSVEAMFEKSETHVTEPQTEGQPQAELSRTAQEPEP